MGLELGPPWLVAAVEGDNGLDVIYRDNFTGAGFERVRRVVRDEPGALTAVLGRDGSIARHPDGSIFQPVQEMRGRNFGTSAEQGHRAYLIGCRLLGETAHPFSSKAGFQSWLFSGFKWGGIALVVLMVLAMIGFHSP